jgi:hypothetical protein
MAKISVHRSNWHQWSTLAPTWERIHNMCPDASFFLSREWVNCWLETFGEDLNPDLMMFVSNGNVVGCCVLVWRTQWVRGIPLRRVYLNCAGENESDSTCVEYNSLLSLPNYAELVAKALGTFLRTKYWDELLLQGVVEHFPICALSSSLDNTEISIRPSHFVELDQIRNRDAGLDDFLSSSTRQQIRRTQRLYEQTRGPCTFRVARTGQEAAEIFTQLADLHQVAWRDRGRPGVFASPQFTSFHRKLIKAVFEHKGIMLVEVRAGTEVIGALYSFLHRGRVYFYQSGFCYTTDGRLKPGMLTHYLAIQHCLKESALNEYDFLAGDSQYKRSFATASRTLRWIVVRRSTVPGIMFRGLRWVKRTYVHVFRKSRRKNQPSCGVECSADLSVSNGETGRVVDKRGD